MPDQCRNQKEIGSRAADEELIKGKSYDYFNHRRDGKSAD